MDALSLWSIAGAVIASTVAAVLVARWVRADKQDVDLGVLLARLEAAAREKELQFRTVEIRLEALEKERDLMRARYHDLRGLVNRCLAAAGHQDRSPTE